MRVGEHQGRKVAVKVLRIYLTTDLNKIASVGHHLRLARTVYRTADRDRVEVLQGSCNVEKPPPSKFAPAVGSDDRQKGLRDGLGMDGQREYQ